MFLRSFVKNNVLFRSMDPLKRKSPDDLYYWFEIKQQKAITLTQKLHFCLALI